MSLQNKFRLLLTVFGVSIVVNVLISVWCIQVYFGSAITQFTSHMASASEIQLIRNLIDRVVMDLGTYADRPDRAEADRIRDRCGDVARHIQSLAAKDTADADGDRWRQMLASAESLAYRCEEYLQLMRRGQTQQAKTYLGESIERDCADKLRESLAMLAHDYDWAISNTTADIGATEASVTALLSANAVVAFLLAATGVFLVRNWVLKPVDALKIATEEHAKGNLGHRIQNPSRDELGALSQAMNRMADSLIDIQKRLLQQERLAALGEVASTVAHNIRNPLAGIRASAQSAMMDAGPHSASYRQHQRIIETVDSLNQWVKQLLLVNRPLELHCRRTAVREMVQAVLTAQRMNAERRRINFSYREADGGCYVYVDPRHIEQAIQVVVDNALDASPECGEIAIAGTPVVGSDRWVDLTVTDRGTGIPQEVRERITSPYFTTKPGGTGIGLHLAKKAVESHGGEILFDSPPSGGTTVTLRLPARDLFGAGDGGNPAGG